MIRATLRKELVVLWTSPVPYVACALVNVAVAVLFIDTLRAREQAVFQPLVPLVGFLILAVAPALTMRTIAEEARTGTLDVLLVAPRTTTSLVVAKWLAVTVTVVAVVAPVGIHAVFLRWWGAPDTAPMVTGTVGLLLLAASVTAVGVAASALTSSLPVAAMGAFVVTLLAWFVQPSPSSSGLRTLSARLSLSERVRGFAGGAIDSGSIAFFLVLTLVAGAVATAAVAGRRARVGRRPVAIAAVAVVALLVLQTWADDHDRLIDLTAGNTLSLTSPTERLVQDLPSRLRITAFISDDAPGRVEAVALLDRYEHANRRIQARVLDPLEHPGEVRRLGVDPTSGGVALEMGGRVEHAAAPLEQDLTTAIARLRRGALPRVCITSGHGELDATSTLSNGFSAAVAVLVANGYEVGTIDLLATPSVPPSCGAVIVPGPSTPLGPAGTALRRWHDQDGRLLVLAESDLHADLDSLLAGTGLTLTGGVVAEGDPGSVIAGDPTSPIIRRYSTGNPVVRNLPPTFFVGAGGIEVDAVTAGGQVRGRTVNRLADSSSSSLLVEDPHADVGIARPGPITVMAAVDDSENVGGVVHRKRLVLVADADFASNAFVGEAGNARLLVQAVDWLTVDDALVSITSNLAEPRPLALTDARRSYALLLTAGIIPGLALIAGGFVWALRRRA